ncbi:hypothetical protein [Streptomyces sp. NPDC056296]
MSREPGKSPEDRELVNRLLRLSEPFLGLPQGREERAGRAAS